MPNLTQHGRRIWKNCNLALSIFTCPLKMDLWIEFCWKASIAPSYNNKLHYKDCSWGLGEWDESGLVALRSHSDVGTHTLAHIIKSVAPKVQFPLDLSGSAWLTTLKFIRMDDGKPRRGNIYWQSEWSHPPEFPLCSVPSIILGIVLNSFEYEGTLLSPCYIPLNKSRNLFLTTGILLPTLPFLPP